MLLKVGHCLTGWWEGGGCLVSCISDTWQQKQWGWSEVCIPCSPHWDLGREITDPSENMLEVMGSLKGCTKVYLL